MIPTIVYTDRVKDGMRQAFITEQVWSPVERRFETRTGIWWVPDEEEDVPEWPGELEFDLGGEG